MAIKLLKGLLDKELIEKIGSGKNVKYQIKIN
jgi:hypothetical protein